MKKQRNGHPALRRTLALAAAGLVLTVSWSASAQEILPCSAAGAGQALLRSQLAGWAGLPSSALSAATVLTIQDNALLLENRRAIQSSAARTPSEQQTVPQDSETHEGTVIEATEGKNAAAAGASDNGVAAKTIHPTHPDGYLVWKNVYIKNTTAYTPDLNALMQTRPAAVFTDEMPQILILHTHGTEAYTMPHGQEYNTDGATRTTDTEYNVVRVGDEMAEVFEEAGISVLHDRTLYDAAGYSDAYDRAETAIQNYLKKYPSIHFILDVHRDAIEDSAGTAYKVISQVGGQNAAQLSIVVGSDGSGLPHEHWRENLKLAVLLQQHVSEEYPTLMRPMYLRNSRYNGHATTGSLLVEVGAAGNSLDEALYAARLFAGSMVEVLNELR